MPLRSKAVVLDSWSIIAYLEDEPSGRKVEELLVNAHERGTPLLTTVVNAGEVWYITARKTSEEAADEAIEDLRRLGIDFVEADWALTKIAAAFKAKGKMSYADCYAAALAKNREASLVTGDPEFKQVSKDIKIHWI
jgi:predicted nucleic acid-binding protein